MAPHNNISESEYVAFKTFLQKQCGILLGDNKQYLVRSRLLPIIKQSRFSSISELIENLLSRHNAALFNQVIEAMTTNETFWFRDNYPYTILQQKLLPTFATVPRQYRVWSAACSSGQEPYSIAMSTIEYEKNNNKPIKLEIIGTDISNQVLEQAKSARYDNLALARGLSPERRSRFFSSCGDKGHMVLSPEVKQRVSFRTLNLLTSYGSLGKFDIVFCRNVLIYFSTDMKKHILQNIAACLNPGGILFLGASESLTGLSEQFDFVRCNPGLYYIKK